MNRCLVTGPSGFIGSALIPLLADAGFQVAGLYNWGVPAPCGRLEVLRADVTDPMGTYRTIAGWQPDVLIHLAAFLDVEGADPYRLVTTNSVGFLHVLEAARLGAAGRLVWASSVMVYGSPSLYGGRAVNERDLVQPQTSYGASKAFNESLAREYGDRFGVRAAGLRFTTVYGPGRWRRGAAGFLVDIAESARFGQARVVAEGDRALDLVYVNDAAAACMVAARADWSGTPVFNIGGGTATVRQVVQAALAAKPSLPFTVLPGGENPWPEHVDGSLSARCLGYRPVVSLADGMRQVVADAQNDRGLSR